MANKEYRHRDHIEDYWANYKDEFEVINQNFFRLPLKMIRLYGVVHVLDQIEDGEVMQYHDYVQYQDKPIPSIDWVEDEVVELDQINAQVIKYSKQWEKHKIFEMEVEGIKPTYELMRDLESQSSEDDFEKTKDDISTIQGEDYDEDPFIIKRRARGQGKAMDKGEFKRQPIPKIRKPKK